MNILFYRFGSICEPDILASFQKIGLTVIEETTEITNKKLTSVQQLSLVENHIKSNQLLFIFSVNYFPVIAKVCNIYKVPYLCWTVDSPVCELFDSSIGLDTNRLFLFDRAQYQDFAPHNPSNTFHLPLAAAVDRFDQVISDITSSDITQYSSDISFVGSLYAEKDPLQAILPTLNAYDQGYINALVEASLALYGYYPVEDVITNEIVDAVKHASKHFYSSGKPVAPSDAYIVSHQYIGYHVATVERVRTLNTLAKYFAVDLYTRSNTALLHGVNVKGGVSTLTEMPKVFHLSKINLNMTIKPIQTGLPLRIFDIMGCGGFCMTNYQAELTDTDLFKIGVDLEAYTSIEELIDKCSFYLSHEEERQKIALNGYQKVKDNHQYIHRIKEMIATL